MLVPVKWLKEYLDVDLKPAEIAAKLTMLGLEVESVSEGEIGFSGVVTARVEEVKKHPNADKLSVCHVTDGTEVLEVVCGASNVRAGMIVALAKIGGSAGEIKIKKSKIRDVTSHGMLCSARELGLAEEADGIMDLSAALPLGVPLDEALGLRDPVLEVNVTPNRPDCLSMIGIARELAAHLGVPLKRPPVQAVEAGISTSDEIQVQGDAQAGCPRYSARVVRGVTVAPSPEWMQQRLRGAGVRPINNLVDITNYVMLETGHPMHAFDRRQIEGNAIVVRWGQHGEKMSTLDGAKHELSDEDVVIADGSKALALGGIMGGEASGIADDTRDVVLEAAYFTPTVIRRTSKRLKIRSESSHRFERGCDPGATPWVLDRAAALMQELAGGTVAPGRVDHYPRPFKPRNISLRVTRVGKMLGLDVERHNIERILRRLELGAEEDLEGIIIYDPDTIRVIVPTFRPDLLEEIDLIEEVVRHVGYDQVPLTAPVGALTSVTEDPATPMLRRTRDTLTGLGLDETVNFIFSRGGGDTAVALANPLSEQEKYLRSTLLDSLIQTAVFNLNHQNDLLDLFEIGRTFRTDPAKRFTQELNLGIVVAGDRPGHWREAKRTVDFYHIKGIVDALLASLGFQATYSRESVGEQEGARLLHPARAVRVEVGGVTVGVLGEVHPKAMSEAKTAVPTALAEIYLERLNQAGVPVPRMTALSPYPRVVRDLAFLVPDGVTYDELRGLISSAKPKHLVKIGVFDVFTGKSIEEGVKSVALSVTFQSPERTLKDEEVESDVKRIVDTLRSRVGARLRG